MKELKLQFPDDFDEKTFMAYVDYAKANMEGVKVIISVPSEAFKNLIDAMKAGVKQP